MHVSATHQLQRSGSVEIDGAKVDIGSRSWTWETIRVGDQWFEPDHIGSQDWTEEWITAGDYIYVLSGIAGDARYHREATSGGDVVSVQGGVGGDSRQDRKDRPLAPGIELAFDLFDLFEFDLLDSDGEISKLERELEGEASTTYRGCHLRTEATQCWVLRVA